MSRPRAKTYNAAGQLTERAFQNRVIGLARAYEWRIFHAPDNRPAGAKGRPQKLASSSAAGFPDLILIRGPRLVVAELKTTTGRIGPGQREWLDAFRALGLRIGTYVEDATALGRLPAPGLDRPNVEAHLWRPADWPHIHNTLNDGQEYRHDLDPLPGEPGPQ